MNDATKAQERTPLETIAFAAWVNCPPDAIPPEYRQHTCEATMVAWRRVTSAIAAALAASPEVQALLRGDAKAAQALVVERAEREPFQGRVRPWMLACFGEEVSNDKLERGDRLLEEVLELLQSGQYPKERVAALVGYVWSRPEGEPAQEVGGVMVTLAAYCLAHGIDMHSAAETELARIWTKVEKIRAKQAAKPKGSALPQAWPAEAERDALAAKLAAAESRVGVLTEALENYRSTLCEGFCGEDTWCDDGHHHPDIQRDCGGCLAASVILKAAALTTSAKEVRDA